MGIGGDHQGRSENPRGGEDIARLSLYVAKGQERADIVWIEFKRPE